LVAPAAAYSAKLKVAVKRITAAVTMIVPNVFFMICYLLWGNLLICLYITEIIVPGFKNKTNIMVTI
jgi:hypothetical protein